MFKRLRNYFLLKKIRKNLSEEFTSVYLNTDNIPELASLILDGTDYVFIKAKIDQNDEIHLILENAYGTLYDAKTTNYRWFLNNVKINQTQKSSLN